MESNFCSRCFATEAANNATVGGTLVPTLALSDKLDVPLDSP